MTYAKRTLAELIDGRDPAWPLVQQWAREASHPVEMLPPAESSGASLISMQVTTRSTLGAVLFETGGIMIDHGWLRLLGSGHPRLPRALPEWNFACGMQPSDTPPPLVLVGDDVLGGLFALDGGRFSDSEHTVWYFAPDALEWEDTEKGYSDFLYFCFVGDLAAFYSPYRWHGWESDVTKLAGDQAFRLTPPLFSDGPAIDDRDRRAVPIAELYESYCGRAGLGIAAEPDGSN